MTIRTAVLGFGTSGRIFHAPFLHADPDFTVSAVVARDPARRALVAAEYPDARVLDSVDDVLTDAADYDLVVVGTPSGTHEDFAARALDAGLHVVVDKPFALTADGGRALVDKARKVGRVLTVFQNRRWDGDFLTLRALIEAGELGTVHRFESRFEWWKPVDEMNETARNSWKNTSTRAQGGGILYDLGTHLIDQAVQLFGPVTDHYLQADTRRDVGAEDDAFLALTHDSGVETLLWMNAVAPAAAPRFHVNGSAAGYTSWGLDNQEPQLKGGMRPGDAGFAVTPDADYGVLSVGEERRSVPTADGDYGAFYRLLSRAILGGAPVPVDPAGPIAVLDLLDNLDTKN